MPDAFAPHSIELLYQAALDACAARDFERAAMQFHAVAMRDPQHVMAWCNCGLMLHELQRYEEALACYDAALTVAPGFARAFFNRGMALSLLDRFEESEQCYARAWQLEPPYPEAHWGQSLAQLYLGNYAQGWANYEWRWQTSFMRHQWLPIGCPQWLGVESLAGQSILVWYEQGAGDFLQFVRYVPVLVAMGARVELLVPAVMARLLLQSMGHLGVRVWVGEQLKSFPPTDYHSPVMSLPLACKTDDVSKIPQSPYLVAAAPDVQVWGERLDQAWRDQWGAKGGIRARVGILWGSGTDSASGADRTAGLSHMARLVQAFNVDTGFGVQWVSLQVGHWRYQLEQAQQHGESFAKHITDLTMWINDWADSAALIAHLDVVMTCDTGVAHLAAAMGKPVWLVLRLQGCWRWLRQSSHPTSSPWYPSVRLFRQQSRGDWSGVMDEVLRALSEAFGVANHQNLGE